jgi:hypothetical protein
MGSGKSSSFSCASAPNASRGAVGALAGIAAGVLAFVARRRRR